MATQETNVYRVIEKLLRESKEPLTCNQLWDKPAVRKLAPDVNKVSDVLGNLWRRSYLDRFAAPKVLGDQAKWAYGWKKEVVPSSKPVPLKKPEVSAREGDDGEIVIELPGYVISIKPRT